MIKLLIKIIGIKVNKMFQPIIIRNILNHIQIIALKHQKHKNNNIKKVYNFTIQWKQPINNKRKRKNNKKDNKEKLIKNPHSNN
jgi:hypothetical protein